MIREAAELGKLLIDPVFYGAEVARGDGRLVVVIPGLFGGDLYLEPLRVWLRRIGYTPIRSSLNVNAGCPMRLRDQIQRQIASWRKECPTWRYWALQLASIGALRQAGRTSLGVRRWADYWDRRATSRAAFWIRTAIFRLAAAPLFRM
jgi:hypothetical protein